MQLNKKVIVNIWNANVHRKMVDSMQLKFDPMNENPSDFEILKWIKSLKAEKSWKCQEVCEKGK